MGQTSAEDSERSGRHSTSNVRQVIRSNRRVTYREVAEKVGISKTRCHEILAENFGMHRVAAKYVPRVLTIPSDS